MHFQPTIQWGISTTATIRQCEARTATCAARPYSPAVRSAKSSTQIAAHGQADQIVERQQPCCRGTRSLSPQARRVFQQVESHYAYALADRRIWVVNPLVATPLSAPPSPTHLYVFRICITVIPVTILPYHCLPI